MIIFRWNCAPLRRKMNLVDHYETQTGAARMTKSLPPTEEMTRAYQASDVSYDGIFFLGVRTTGVFCKPSCHVRKPYPKNVEFFATPQEAMFAGYRPCKRCQPLKINGLPVWAESLLSDLEADPT